MIKRTLTLLLAFTAAALLAADLKPMNLAKPRFEGDGNYNKDLRIALFLDKTPEFVFGKIRRKINIQETDPLGFPRWTFRRCDKTGEYLATYKLLVVDHRMTIEGRHVWSLNLDFYKKTYNEKWKCWDARYKLLPKGIDWHKENEKE